MRQIILGDPIVYKLMCDKACAAGDHDYDVRIAHTVDRNLYSYTCRSCKHAYIDSEPMLVLRH